MEEAAEREAREAREKAARDAAQQETDAQKEIKAKQVRRPTTPHHTTGTGQRAGRQAGGRGGERLMGGDGVAGRVGPGPDRAQVQRAQA